MRKKSQHEKWKTQRHLNRYTEIIGILVKHGFGEFLDRSHLSRLKFLRGKRPGAAGSTREHSKWVRIRLLLEDLGVTYIKFGQIMSGRPDILPENLIRELEKLQSQVPPFSSEEARAILEEELKKPISEVFLEFSDTPLASASIAQVHTALLITGERVAIKIQRPHLEDIITTDIEIMHFFAALLEKLILRDAISATAVIKEFGQSLNREIDFTAEAANIKKFGAQFRKTDRLRVPKVYEEYTTKRVLVMERIDGIKVSDVRAILSAGCDPRKIALNGARIVARQIFEYGFFHADPHPGNILVLDDDVICFLDFGMMGFLLPRHRDILISMMMALFDRDERKLAQGILELSGSRSPANTEALEYEIFEIMDTYASMSVEAVNLGELVTRILRIVIAYRIQMPPGFFLLVKALVTIEGVALRLYPGFRMVVELEPVIKKMFLRSLRPDRILKELYGVSYQTFSLLKNLPRNAGDIIEKIKSGRITLHIDSSDLNPILRKADQITARVSFSVVLASLVVGSSIVINARIPPLWNNVSLFGIVGYLGAACIGFWLLISLLRSSKMRDK
ncbi:MAG: AarF/ABC1/UbiB kinase family protein [Spirochaetales bacterium]|nr:AarF/ABC1/UbiB kinase family protein [Spirochaetales bacterium]